MTLHLGVAPWEVLPPSFALLILHILGQLLTVNTDSLSTEFTSVLLDHFLTALSNNIGASTSSLVLLLHAQVAHLACVQSLFSVLQVSNVAFQCLKVLQVLSSAHLLQFGVGRDLWLVNPLERGLASFSLRLLTDLSQTSLCTSSSLIAISPLVDRSESRVLNVTFIRHARDLSLNGLVMRFKSSTLLVNVLTQSLKSLLLQFSDVMRLGRNLAQGMLRVSTRHGQEVLAVNEDTTLLQDAEGSLGTGLLDVPEEFLFDTL